MRNSQSIDTHIGAFEATAALTDEGQCVLIRTGYDDSRPMPVVPVSVRSIDYQVGMTLTREGDVLSSNISRIDGKAVSDSARQVILDAAKGVFGAYIQNAGSQVFDIALQEDLKKHIGALDAQISGLGAHRTQLEEQLLQVEDRLTS